MLLQSHVDSYISRVLELAVVPFHQVSQKGPIIHTRRGWENILHVFVLQCTWQ